MGAEARELHRTLEFIGLRAQATTIGLIQVCTELVRVGVLEDDAIQRSKDSIHRELSVSHGRDRNQAEFEETLRHRLDPIFPKASAVGQSATGRWRRGDANNTGSGGF
jgi:hypothetical protein